MTMTIAEIASRIRGEVIGDGSITIQGFSSAEQARPGDLTFAEKEAYFAAAEASPAAGIIVSGNFVSARKPLIRVQNPRVAVARLLPLFFPQEKPLPGVHSSAVVDPTASVDPSAHIGPFCVLEAGVKIGAGAALLGGNHIGHDTQIAEDSLLHPNVVVYPKCRIGKRVIIHAGSVIGSDGYGYVLDEGKHRKVLQVGQVIIEDDVEIGANSAIDRGALGATVIGQGTKIDNLVHVAHNVMMGKHCLILGQVGFGGSTQLGDYCVVASQAGVADHLKLGRQATVGAKSGVMRDIPDGGTVLGSPAFPDKQTKRQWIALQQLPEMIRQMRDLEKEVQQLKGRLSTSNGDPGVQVS
ncbi:MAG: UDP-3-O-(3-hydroxymyristoyl)glucosamine N-acyltransferase [Verrucomicrobiota bacterium]|nr:UDP-3-O-(3-hydroxymyristoyl)glucosamine N-acyltransferase [Verrucomicrobiota bacterium]